MKNLISITIVLLLFSTHTFGRDNKSTEDLTVYKNNLQWKITQISRGAFAFTYERQVTEKVGVEIGLGATNNDYLFPLISDADYWDYDNVYQGGLYSSIALKIYPRGMENFKGVYASPFFRYIQYSLSSTTSNSQELERARETKDFGFVIGYQTGSTIMVNFFIGASYNIQAYDKVIPPAAPSTAYTIKKINKTMPLPVGGISLGFAF